MSQDYETRCNGIIRSAAFGWDEYEGVRRPQIVCRFELLDGDDAGFHDTWFGSLSEDTSSKGVPFFEYTVRSLRACGWTGDDISEIPKLIEAGELSKEVPLTRRHKQNERGEWKTTIRYVGGGGGAKIDLKENAMSPADVASFARRMKSRLGGKQSGGATQRSAAPPARSAAPPQSRHQAPSGYRDDRDVPPPDDDPIPF